MLTIPVGELFRPKLILHVFLSLVSSSVSPWLVVLHLTPSIFLQVFRPFLFPLVRILKLSTTVYFLAFSLHVQPIVTVSYQLLPISIFFHTSTVALMVSFRTFYFLDFLAYLLQKSVSVASSLLDSRVLHKYIKVKFTLEQAMKAQRGSRGIALLFL